MENVFYLDQINNAGIFNIRIATSDILHSAKFMALLRVWSFRVCLLKLVPGNVRCSQRTGQGRASAHSYVYLRKKSWLSLAIYAV